MCIANLLILHKHKCTFIMQATLDSHYSGHSGYFGCEQAITVALLGQIILPATFFLWFQSMVTRGVVCLCSRWNYFPPRIFGINLQQKMVSTQKMGNHQVVVIILQKQEAKCFVNCTDQVINPKSLDEQNFNQFSVQARVRKLDNVKLAD